MFVDIQSHKNEEMIDELIILFRNKELGVLTRSNLKSVRMFTEGVQQYLDSIKEKNEEGQILFDVNEIRELLAQAYIVLMCINSN